MIVRIVIGILVVVAISAWAYWIENKKEKD